MKISDSKTCRPALFLDRDGVINIDHAYVHKSDDFIFIDGIFELCLKASQLGYLIFVTTNQSGIGRGFYTEDDFFKLTDWMNEVFKTQGIHIDKVYFCPFHPEHGLGDYKKKSFCRKPAPGMIHKAEKEFDVDLAKSVLVGDKETDIQAGVAAGVGCNLLYSPSGLGDKGETLAFAVVEDLVEIGKFLSPIDEL